jgi:hypothetical protein
MRIPTRYSPLLFSALLSAIMVSIVTAFVLIRSQGLHADLPATWLRNCLITWPVAFAAVFVVAPVVRRTVARITTLMVLGLLGGVSLRAEAQSRAAAPARWEFLITSGKLLPTGEQREAIARGGVTAAQLSFVPGPVAVTATFGWARSRDVTSAERHRLDAFLYDIGAELRGPSVHMGRLSLMPFSGAGVGGRSYNYRRLAMDATHNRAGYLGAGAEIGVQRVRLRLEVRDYLTGFKPLQGAGASSTRNDVVLMVGLRLASRQ